MDLELHDKVALVTGGSSGIGLATVARLLAEGATVWSVARGLERLQQSVDTLAGQAISTEKLHIATLDVLDVGRVAALANKIEATSGGLDILINNAGQARLSTFATTSLEDWDAELRLKFMSVINPTTAVLPMLRASGSGSIVIVNSLLARQPEPHMVCTSAARAGVQNLAKSLSVELAPSIRVNTILLGTVNSGQWRTRFEQRGRPGQSFDDWLAEMAAERHIPMGRMGKPEEAADTIAFLASPRAGFITGAAIEVAGGVSRFA